MDSKIKKSKNSSFVYTQCTRSKPILWTQAASRYMPCHSTCYLYLMHYGTFHCQHYMACLLVTISLKPSMKPQYPPWYPARERLFYLPGRCTSAPVSYLLIYFRSAGRYLYLLHENIKPCTYTSPSHSYTFVHVISVLKCPG